MKIRQGEVWFAYFPFEEDSSRGKSRPVIVLDVYDGGALVLSAKITTHAIRSDDPYDTPITQYAFAGLRYPSVARVSKILELPVEYFNFRLGTLHPDDYESIVTAFKRLASD